MSLEPIHRLSNQLLETLAASLRGGALAGGLTSSTLRQIAGPDHGELLLALRGFQDLGFTPLQTAVLVDAIRSTRVRIPHPTSLFDLVLTGPEVPGVPTPDTAARTLALIQEAASEVTLVGYAVHNGRRLFEPLHRRMEEVPGLRVVFCLNILREYGSTTEDSSIIRDFAKDFRSKHWPWMPPPAVYYDARSLALRPEDRASLHAKCVIVDRRVALITSANFTDAAHHRNIEAGVLVRHEPLVARLADYFSALIGDGRLVKCPIEGARK